LDTNILVYAIDEDSDYFERARSVIEKSEKTLLTTSKNLAEFLAVVTRSSAYDLEPQLALDILQEILQGVDVWDQRLSQRDCMTKDGHKINAGLRYTF